MSQHEFDNDNDGERRKAMNAVSELLGFDQDDPVSRGLRLTARQLLGVAVFSGAINLLMLAGPLYMLQVYDRVITSRNVATLAGLSLILLVAYLLQGYFDALRARMLSRIGALFDAGLQEPIHAALAALPLKGTKALLAQQPLRDLDQIRTFLSGAGPTAFLDMPWAPLFLLALLLFHPLIGGIALFGAGAIVATAFLVERQSKTAAKLATESAAQRQVLADATQRNAEAIRALGMTGRLGARWSNANERYLQENVRAADIYANLGSSAKILRFILQSAILGAGAYLVVNEQASGGVMIASSIMMGRALAPIEIALSTWKQLAAARQGVARLREILIVTAAPPAPPVTLPRPRRTLTVDALSVAVPGGNRLLVSGVSFSLNPGDGLALLGPSASGKSSLSKALVGVLPAARGVVRLDGAALDQWESDDLGRHIGYLPQEISLLDGSVAENIGRFDPAAASEAILEAARVAGAHEMILSLPEGYATRVGEGGASLSAGQRQRIGLARAAFGDPFLIVLDEPNANLDTEGEAALTRAIATLRKRECIVVVVSHRPSALAALNMALVLFGGRAVAFGAQEEVFERLSRMAGAPSNDDRPTVAGPVDAARSARS